MYRNKARVCSVGFGVRPPMTVHTTKPTETNQKISSGALEAQKLFEDVLVLVHEFEVCLYGNIICRCSSRFNKFTHLLAERGLAAASNVDRDRLRLRGRLHNLALAQVAVHRYAYFRQPFPLKHMFFFRGKRFSPVTTTQQEIQVENHPEFQGLG
jgi:hypothetical protein